MSDGAAIELILRATKAGIRLELNDAGLLRAHFKGALSPAWHTRIHEQRAELREELSLHGVETPDYVLVEDSAALADHLGRLSSAQRIGIDTETSGLSWRSDRLLLVQMAIDNAPVVLVDALKVDVRLLQPVFDARRRLIFFNAAFDLGMLTAAGLCLEECPIYDAMLAERVLDARGEPYPPHYHSLEAVVSRRLRQHLPKEQQLSDWSVRPLSSEQLGYAARDAAVLLDLAPFQQTDIDEGGLRRTVELENAIVHQIVEMEHTGVPIDRGLWTERADAAHAEHLRLRGELYTVIGQEPPDITAKVKKAEVWKSHPQLLALLQARGNVVESTNEAALNSILADEELAPLLLDFRKAGQRTQTFGLTYLAKYLPDAADARLHPRFLQTGAQTGRMSAREPNIQQVPHSAEYRTCFRPGPGRVWIKSDFGQVELRLIADRTGDETLIDGFMRGVDIHALTAGLIAGKDPAEVTEGERQRAKAVNFGLSYGMGANKLQAYAWQSYHVRLSLEESIEMRQRFFSNYRGIRTWHSEHHTPFNVEVAIDTYTPIGRRRKDVSRLTEQLATPIQGAGGDAMKQALELCWQRRSCKPASAHLMLTVHDELCLEAAVEDADAAAAWLHACMIDGLQPLLERVPAAAKTTIAQSWAGEPLEKT